MAAVRRNGTLAVYVNGEWKSESLDQPDRPLTVTTNSPLRIGFGGLTYFSGAMSDVRICRGALSGQEIAELVDREP